MENFNTLGTGGFFPLAKNTDATQVCDATQVSDDGAVNFLLVTPALPSLFAFAASPLRLCTKEKTLWFSGYGNFDNHI